MIPICVWIQIMLGLTIQQHFPSEEWTWHVGHEYGKPNEANIVRDYLKMLVDYCKSLVRQQGQDRRMATRMEEVHVIEQFQATSEFGKNYHPLANPPWW
jgi:hypothetical protein